MRVAVSVPESLPELGGGWTLESELFQTLLKEVSASRHEFVFFGAPAERPSIIPAGLPYFALVSRRSLVRRSLGRAQRIAAKSVRSFAEFIEMQVPPPSRPAIFDNQKVDFLLTFGPRAFTMDIPFLIFVWDIEFLIQPYFPELSANGEWDKRFEHYERLIRRATFVVTGTKVLRDQIMHHYRISDNRIMVLPYPAPSDVLFCPTGSRADRRETDSTFIYPAQFWAHKNHITLIKALAVLKQKYNLTPRIIFPGSDPGNREYVQDYASQLGVKEQVDFPGFLPRKDLLDLYRKATALVYPTTFGPDNLPPLEAFALGCPVIASRIPGAEEQLGDAAILVDPYDAEALADAMRNVHADRELRNQLAGRGAAKVQNWTSAHVIKEILAALDRFEPVRNLWR